MKNKNIFMKTSLATLVLISSVVMYFIITLDILPTIFVVAIGLLLGIFLIINIFLQKSSKKGVKYLGRLFTIFLIALFSYGVYMLNSTNNMLLNIINTQTATTTLSTVVLKESSVKNLSDINGELYYGEPSKDLVLENKDHYTINPNLSLRQERLYVNLVNNLIDGKSKAIIIDESLRSLIVETYPNFDKETKVVDRLIVKIKDENDTISNANLRTDSVNIYISGVDTQGSPKSFSRSDVNMILTYNPKTSTILLTSMPRDYFVPLSCKDGALDKFTNSGIYGIKCSVNTMEDLFKINIDYYVRLNFTGFMNIIDIFGTIDVKSEYAFTTTGGAHTFKKGINSLNSTEALAFVRERKTIPGGDGGRILNQQRVVDALINKMLSLDSITNFNEISKAISKNVVTTIPSKGVTAIMKNYIENNNKVIIKKNAVTGVPGFSRNTYTFPKERAAVLFPNRESVKQATALIDEVFNAK